MTVIATWDAIERGYIFCLEYGCVVCYDSHDEATAIAHGWRFTGPHAEEWIRHTNFFDVGPTVHHGNCGQHLYAWVEPLPEPKEDWMRRCLAKVRWTVIRSAKRLLTG